MNVAVFVLLAKLMHACTPSRPTHPCAYDFDAATVDRLIAVMDPCGKGQPTAVLVDILARDPSLPVRSHAAYNIRGRRDPIAIDGLDRLIGEALPLGRSDLLVTASWAWPRSTTGTRSRGS